MDERSNTSRGTPRELSSGRLALYLAASWDAGDRERITSGEIARATGINATQVRRDLSRVFGRLGRRGSGYAVSPLASVLEKLLASHIAEVEAVAAATRWRASQLERVLAALQERDRTAVEENA